MIDREARPQDEATVRRAHAGDIDPVVAIHVRSFRGFFLTFLGPSFLKLFYSEVFASGEGILLVAESDTRVVGFVAGVTQQSGFYRRLLKRRKWTFARASFGALLKKPSIAGRLFRALRKPKETSESPAAACLVSIAVAPGTEGRGLGATLVRAFCDDLRERSVSDVCLTTDRDGNDAVNEFYARMGFTLVRTFTTPEGRRMNEYFMRLERRSE